MKNINRSEWKLYKFEDFVENVREQTIPKPADSEKYIGLEHLDSESLHIIRWGTKISLKGTKLKMKKDDILFARRNAYLKRVAISPHDGLFSAHGLVFRPISDVVFENFLPFFLLSDVFWSRAIKISVGSLSPTINWGTLRHEEFKLPPLDEQKRLADLLWSVDEVLKKWKTILCSLNTIYLAVGKDFFIKNNKMKVKLSKIANINMGQSPPGIAYNMEGSGIPFLQGNAEFGEIFPKHAKSTTIVTKKSNIGDILLSVRAPVGAINISDKEYCIGRGLSSISMKDRNLNNYLRHVLLFLQSDLDKISTGSTFKAINKESLESLEIPFPFKNTIISFERNMSEITQNIIKVREYVNLCKGIKKQIINKIFG